MRNFDHSSRKLEARSHLRQVVACALFLSSLLPPNLFAETSSTEVLSATSPTTTAEYLARDLIVCEEKDAELSLGLMHHLGYGKVYDPELASAWIHAAAYDGCETALSILEAMQNPEQWIQSETGDAGLIVNNVDPSLSTYFLKLDDGSGRYTLNLEAARKWNLEQAREGNPVALYNCHIMGAQLDQIHYLLTHLPRYFRQIRLSIQDPAIDTSIVDWMTHPEHYNHPDTWMFAFQNELETNGLEPHTLAKLNNAIEGGSLRATLYRLKFLNDSMLSESDSVLPNEEAIQLLLEQNYPPAWDVQCARLTGTLESIEFVEDPEPYFSAVQTALRFGYEFNPLRLLGTLMSKTRDETVFHRGFNIYEKAASLGMTSAYYSLGFCYRNGFGIAKDMSMATQWFEKAEQHEDASASFQLGWIHLARNQTEKAFQHFETAAEQGNEAAQFKCGLMLMDGIGVTANRLQAYAWFEAAAEQANEAACLFCGYFQENGWLGERDLDQALYYYRKSIISQSEQSFANFFRFLQEHVHDPESSNDGMFMVADEMLQWIPPRYLVNLGILSWNHDDWKAPTKWDRANRYFEEAASRGDESGKLMARVLSIHGYPGHATDESVLYFQSVLEKPANEMDEHFRAQAVSGLALAYLNGMGAPLDYVAYLDLMEKEHIPLAIKNQLDQTARKSNAYQIFLKQGNHSDRYRIARFSARKHPEKAAPEPVIQINPQYPRYLKEMGIDGKVTLSMIIDSDGSIIAPMVEESTHPGFEEPAMRALAHWKFLPGLMDSEPVKTRIRLPMVFRAE